MTTSSGQQNTNQHSETQPWAPAVPALQSILGNIQGLQGQSGINPTENAAISQLQSRAGGLPNLSGPITQQARAFSGGDPFSVLNPAYQQYQSSLSGIANPNNLNPLNTPGFGNALNTLNQDITNQINGEFAGAGRSGSGYNTQTLARGLSQGEGQLLANQYNTNVGNLLTAAGGLQGAGLGTNSALGTNVGNSVNLANQIPGLALSGPNALLSAGQVPFNLQAGQQGALTGLAVPIAGLGGQSQGQSQTNTSFTPSLESALLAPFQGGQNSGVSGAAGVGQGILSGLQWLNAPFSWAGA